MKNTPHSPEHTQDQETQKAPETYALTTVTDKTRKHVDTLVGTELAEETTLRETQEAQQKQLQTPASRQMKQEEEVQQQHAMEEAEKLLGKIEKLAMKLVSKNMEHRTLDPREFIPIFAQWRSRGVTNKEVITTDQLKSAMQELEDIVRSANVPIDIEKLKKSIGKVKGPRGVTRLFATLLPPLRKMHRGFTVHRAENVEEIASQMQDALQKDRRTHTADTLAA